MSLLTMSYIEESVSVWYNYFRYNINFMGGLNVHLIITQGMGWLEGVSGSMFSGKSEELIRRVRRAKFANQKVVVFKHSSDKRYDNVKVASHSLMTIEAVPAGSVEEMEKLFFANYYDVEVIGIDEVQFYGKDVVPL